MDTQTTKRSMSAKEMLSASFAALTRQERTRVAAMFGSILALHVLGLFILLAFVVPAHYRGLGIGVSVLAYTLGLRHAFDADHISAIDNTTRKSMNDRQGTGKPRPLAYGYFFSLGHSSVVVAIGVGIIVAEKTVFQAVSNNNSGLQQFGGLFGTIVSASFLFLIGLLNLVVLAGIARVFASMRRGEYDEAELERQLENRGFFYRFLGRWLRRSTRNGTCTRSASCSGMGFDTATEVALLATTALYASRHVPWYAIICLPILFTAGMALMDTIDGLVHEPRLRLGLFQPGPQGLLQPGHHRTVGRHLFFHRRCGDSGPGPGRGPRPQQAPAAFGASCTISTSTRPAS